MYPNRTVKHALTQRTAFLMNKITNTQYEKEKVKPSESSERRHEREKRPRRDRRRQNSSQLFTAHTS